MTSYGKTPTAFMRSDTDAVNLAAVMALRDAGANFITNFSRVPDVQNWLEKRSRAIGRKRAQASPAETRVTENQVVVPSEAAAPATVTAEDIPAGEADDAL